MSLEVPLQLPHWEWRTFAPSLDRLRTRIGSVETRLEATRAETYLLNPRSSHSVKIAGKAFQLKWRKQVDPEGLELWDPILRSPFPVPSFLMAQLHSAWGLPFEGMAEGNLDQTAFLDALQQRVPTLRCVDVIKQHAWFSLDGATCKFTRFAGLGTRLESFCIEHEDPGILKPVLRRLGLDTHENINVPKGLKRALGIN